MVSIMVGIPLIFGVMFELLIDDEPPLWNINKTPISSLFKSRRTSYAKDGFKTITFDKFLELYSINPKKWSWDDTYYHYWETEGKKNGVFYIFEDKIENTFIFTDKVELYWETEKDKRRFNKWVKEINDKEFRDKETSEYKRVLEDVQKDVQIKMDAIQKEREAELKRIEEECKKNQDEYDRLMNEVINLANAASISTKKMVNNPSQIDYTTTSNAEGNKYICQYTVTTTVPDEEFNVAYIPNEKSNKVYIDRAHKDLLKDNNYRLMYQGQVCEYFETDCGTPYIHTSDGQFLEVIFE